MKSAIRNVGLALAASGMLLLPCEAQVSFQLFESGSTSATTATRNPGAVLTLDVVAVSITASPGISGNLGSFTYRISFPNEDFMLQNNTFVAPFDNESVPGGLNGSIPWNGLPAPILNNADAGSPGATTLVSDIYRTTATQTGTPVSGPNAILESFRVQVPRAPGTYPVRLNVLEAADVNGALHPTISGTEFMLTVVPEPTITTWPATEVPNYAVDFDGADGRVQVGTNLFPTVTNSFTIELWVNPTGSRSETPEANTGISDITGQRYAVFPDQGYDSYREMDPAGAMNHAGAGLSIGYDGISVVEHGYNYLPTTLVYSNAISGWTHVALVYINKTPLLYVNGTRVRIGFRSMKTFVHASANLGGSTQGIGHGNYQGQLDEVRIWNRALNESEVAESMNGRFNGTEAGLVVYYRCDDNNGTSISDIAPASPNNPGVLTNGAEFAPSGMPPPSFIYGPSVTMNGLANPGDIGGTVWFEWGTTMNYGNVTAAQAVAGGSGDTRFFQTLTGLAAGSYHFRAVGSNSFNVSFGLDQSFTLLHGTPLLRIEPLPGGQVRLFWPTIGPLFRLQSNPDLNPAAWFAVPAPYFVVGTNWVVTNAMSAPAQFYRLINP